MSRATEEMQNAFLEATVRKLEEQGKILTEIREGISQITAQSGRSQDITEGLQLLRTLSQEQEALKRQVGKLPSMLLLSWDSAQGPPNNVVQHQHHFPKVLWVTVGLFLAMAVACAGWYHASAQLNDFIGSDTKYRFLALESTDKQLQEKLWITDSLLRVNPRLRQTVLEKEAANKRYQELIYRARQMEKEAQALKAKGRSERPHANNKRKHLPPDRR